MDTTILSRGQAWTIEDRKELGELAAAGLCAAAIAERLGRTPAAIRGEAWRQELRLAPDVVWWTSGERDQLRGLARTTTYSEAAATMGRTAAALRDQASEMNLYWRNTQNVGRQYTQLEDSKILAAAERREPLRAVALELGGRTRKAVQGRLTRLRRKGRGGRQAPILA
jgi:hypothetical protein